MHRHLSIALVAVTAIYAAAPEDPVQVFQARVKQYVDLNKAVAKKAPKLPDQATPEQMQAHEEALSKGIRAARSTAKQGDVFVPVVQQYLANLIKKHFQGPQKAENRATVKEGNPKYEGPRAGLPIRLEANGPYPKNSPVSTIPPFLLLHLPKLPQEVEYRFIGRTLILHDVAANIIVDYLPEVLPK